MHLDVKIVVSVSLLMRFFIAMQSYSGTGKPPMFGDYEAQRHWQEITVNLPIKDWYFNTTDNDLNYWGLDYPALTAYHSLLLGHAAKHMNESWVSLYQSRGIESNDHKTFMRYSVVLVDILVYLPALLLWFTDESNANSDSKPKSKSKEQSSWLFLVAALSPGLLLIDHGHFQYNSASLGLVALSLVAIRRKWALLGAALYCAAINYKQIALYFAIPYFGFYLRWCASANLDHPSGKAAPSRTERLRTFLVRLSAVGSVVIASFVITWLPFFLHADDGMQMGRQILFRIFPFYRGIFEDKVANVWCSVNLVFKLRNYFAGERLVQLCTMTTLLSNMPCLLHLVFAPLKNREELVSRFVYALFNSSLLFFLFSFQVHEKSVLYACLMATLLVARHPLACSAFLVFSAVSMWPLLVKDGLIFALFASCGLFICLTHFVFGFGFGGATNGRLATLTLTTAGVIQLVPCCLSLVLSAPALYPDIFPVVISAISCGYFVLFSAYWHLVQFGFLSGSKA